MLESTTCSRSAKPRRVAIIGAGIFGLSLGLALHRKGHQVTIFDKYPYDKTHYQPSERDPELAASVDHNKIFRASYGKKLAYQHLALSSREKWLEIDKARGQAETPLFSPCGMLRVQPTSKLSDLEKETLANMQRDGIRESQFVKSLPQDRERAVKLGWGSKLLDFRIPEDDEGTSFEAVLDSLGGFTRCADGCAYLREVAEKEGVSSVLGPKVGWFEELVVEQSDSAGWRRAIGLRTADGMVHEADTVVVAAGSSSTQVLPELSYHFESSAGSIATFRIDPQDTVLWDKYSPEKFPVMTWKSAPRSDTGKDMGSVYVLPRTAEGLVKIGYRGIKFTNFQPAPKGTPFTQNGMWSIPLPSSENSSIPDAASQAIRYFVSIFLPDFKDIPFYSTKLCWYTDTLDNSFLIDYVPSYSGNSVFVCTGGSGHGAKFMPVLGEHAADIFESGVESTSSMRPHWRWREDLPRKNGLEDGPDGPRNIGKRRAK